MKNYYYILGIPPNSSSEEIKKAYRKLSLKFHPDKNDGDKFFEERFKEIQEAFQTLSDSEQKRKYDISFNSFFNKESDFEKKLREEEFKRKADNLRRKEQEQAKYKTPDEKFQTFSQSSQKQSSVFEKPTVSSINTAKKWLSSLLGITILTIIIIVTNNNRRAPQNQYSNYDRVITKPTPTVSTDTVILVETMPFKVVEFDIYENCIGRDGSQNENYIDLNWDCFEHFIEIYKRNNDTSIYKIDVKYILPNGELLQVDKKKSDYSFSQELKLYQYYNASKVTLNNGTTRDVSSLNESTKHDNIFDLQKIKINKSNFLKGVYKMEIYCNDILVGNTIFVAR